MEKLQRLILLFVTWTVMVFVVDAEDFCAAKSNGLHANPTDCSKYYSCWNHQAYALTCPGGLEFNSQGGYCDWPANANCQTIDEIAAQSTSGTNSNTTSLPITTEDNENTTEPVLAPASCDSNNCQAPLCYCFSDAIPLGLPIEQVPQFVLPTFDDAVTIFNVDFYRELFQRKNPGNCSITGTLFLSHNFTDYTLVDELYSNFNLEIASHSCTHRTPETWWTQATEEEWEQEILCQKNNILDRTSADIVHGWRSPFLRLGGNKQIQLLKDNGFNYDSSIPIVSTATPHWPFTLENKFTGMCVVPPCPTHSFPGFFEVPLQSYFDRDGYACSMYDGCYATPRNASETFNLFKTNFDRHYHTNKAPFPMFGHASYFQQKAFHFQGFLQFIEYILNLDDVYIVSIKKMLQWMDNPLNLEEMLETSDFSC